MSPKKRFSKQELKQDELKIAFVNFLGYYNANKKRVNYLVFAGIAIIAVVTLLKISIGSMNRNANDSLNSGLESYAKAVAPSGQDKDPQSQDKEPQEKLKSAKDSFQMVVTNYPHSSAYEYAMLMMGNADYQLHDFNKAIEDYQAFVAKYGKSPLAVQARNGLAKSYESLSQLDKALEMYQAMMNGPFDYYSKEELYLDIARVYEGQNKPDEALKMYQKFQDEFKDSSRLAMVKNKISALS